VRLFIERQKNDAADAEAIFEAALRPTMRFVEPKSEEQLARSITFSTREQLLKQRTDCINSLRSYLQEFGYVGARGREARHHIPPPQTLPGVGPISALAIETFAPPLEQIRRRRDFAAWLGLVPRQNSSGGKQRLGRHREWGSATSAAC
jgi:transposase